MQIPEEDFKSYIQIKLGLAVESVRHDMCRVRIINRWFADRDLTPENVERFFFELKERGLKNNSLNTYHTAFCHIRDYYKDRKLPSDFFDGFKSFKKTKPNIVIFTEEEIHLLENTKLTYGHFRGKDVSFLDFRYRTLNRFLAETGCRFGEAAGLKIMNLNLSAGKATFIETKTNQNRTVFITGPLLIQLKQITEGFGPDDLVFRNSVESQIHPQDYINDLKKRARTAGIINLKKVHPHNFRHTYATMFLEAGVPITEVSKLLGHKDIQTTFDTYMHLADRTLQKAALRHPLVRKSVAPLETIKALKETIDDFQIDTDPRFFYSITVSEKGLLLSVQPKNK